MNPTVSAVGVSPTLATNVRDVVSDSAVTIPSTVAVNQQVELSTSQRGSISTCSQPALSVSDSVPFNNFKPFATNNIYSLINSTLINARCLHSKLADFHFIM